MPSPSNSSISFQDLGVTLTNRRTIRQAPDRESISQAIDFSIYFLDQEWRYQAACNDVDSSFFFPERGIPGEHIRDLCFSCPVRLDCLQYSVDTMPKFGWFGGHPEAGRKNVRRFMRRGYDLETADAAVLADSLARMRERKTRRPQTQTSPEFALVG